MGFTTLIVSKIAGSAIFASAPVQGILTALGLAGASITTQVVVLLVMGSISAIALMVAMGVGLYLFKNKNSTQKKSSINKPANKSANQSKLKKSKKEKRKAAEQKKDKRNDNAALTTRRTSESAEEDIVVIPSNSTSIMLAQESAAFLSSFKEGLNEAIMEQIGLNTDGLTPGALETRLEKMRHSTVEQLEKELAQVLALDPVGVAEVQDILSKVPVKDRPNGIESEILKLYQRKTAPEGANESEDVNDFDSESNTGIDIGIVKMYLNRVKGIYISPYYLPTQTIANALPILFCLATRYGLRNYIDGERQQEDIQKAQNLKLIYEAFRIELAACLADADLRKEDARTTLLTRLNLAAALDGQKTEDEESLTSAFLEQLKQRQIACVTTLCSDDALKEALGFGKPIIDGDYEQRIHLDMFCNLDTQALMLLLAKYTGHYLAAAEEPLRHIHHVLAKPIQKQNDGLYFSFVTESESETDLTFVLNSDSSLHTLEHCVRILYCLAIQLKEQQNTAYSQQVAARYKCFSAELQLKKSIEKAKEYFKPTCDSLPDFSWETLESAIRREKPESIVQYISGYISQAKADALYQARILAAQQALSAERSQLVPGKVKELDKNIRTNKPNDIEQYTRDFIQEAQAERAAREAERAHARAERIEKVRQAVANDTFKSINLGRFIASDELKEYLVIICPTILEKAAQGDEALTELIAQLPADAVRKSYFICINIVSCLEDKLKFFGTELKESESKQVVDDIACYQKLKNVIEPLIETLEPALAKKNKAKKSGR